MSTCDARIARLTLVPTTIAVVEVVANSSIAARIYLSPTVRHGMYTAFGNET